MPTSGAVGDGPSVTREIVGLIPATGFFLYELQIFVPDVPDVFYV